MLRFQTVKKLLDMLLDKPEIDENVVSESLKVKKAVVEIDEFDLKALKFLNGSQLQSSVQIVEHSL